MLIWRCQGLWAQEDVRDVYLPSSLKPAPGWAQAACLSHGAAWFRPEGVEEDVAWLSQVSLSDLLLFFCPGRKGGAFLSQNFPSPFPFL